MEFQQEKKFQHLLGYLIPHRNILILAVFLMLCESAATLATPWFAGQFAERLLREEAVWRLSASQILGLWLGVFVVQAVLRFFNSFLVTSCGAKILARLSNRLYDHLQALPVGYFHGRRRGDVLALLSNDVAILSHFITGTVTGLVPMLLTLLGAFVLMARIDWRIALLAACLIPLFFLALKFLGRGIRPVSSQLVQRQADMLAVAEENLGLLPLIKTFNREALESGRFQDHTSDVLRLRTRQLRQQAVLSPVVQLLASSGILLILWVSSGHLREGSLSAPELISMLLYGLLFARPVSGLANLYGQVQQARGASERLLKAFATSPEPDDKGKAELPPVRGEIEFQNVRFHHPGRPDTFHDFNLHINTGETIAITGPNGSGKSTLLHLLMRLSDPQSGTVRIDGIDIREVSLGSLRRQIGLVAQNVLLSNGTVLENIAYGLPEAEMEAIETAARAAQAHEFISQLPDGYMTGIGDQGVKLSGGQRQRIALARALLTDPGILLLDEATAMFDPDGEQRFIEESRRLLHTRTVIIVTHRPASLALADRILQLQPE